MTDHVGSCPDVGDVKKTPVSGTQTCHPRGDEEGRRCGSSENWSWVSRVTTSSVIKVRSDYVVMTGGQTTHHVCNLTGT